MRTRQVLIPAALLAVLLAGCGSSKSSSTAANAPISTSKSTTASKPAKKRANQGKKAPAKTHHAKTKAAPSSKAHTTTSSSTSSTTTRSSSTTHHTAVAKPVYTRPLHVTLAGENHHPTANKKWFYTVTATDAKGKPLSGRVDTEFAFQGTVVGHETPPVHALKHGRLHDGVTFPARAVGEPISIQVVVHTSIGSVTLDWPVKVKK